MAHDIARGWLTLVVTACTMLGPYTPAASARPDASPLGCVPAIGTLQLIPPLPGIVLPLLPRSRGPADFADLAPAPAGLGFPRAVELRDNTQGFNDTVEVVLRRGSLYTRPRHSDSPWRKIPTPACLDGGIVATSVDNNLVVAIDRDGFIYSLANVLGAPWTWNWTRLYGAPIWLNAGMTIPPAQIATPTDNRWAISDRVSTSFTDTAGNTHPVTAGLVQLVGLDATGSRIYFQDPWLPADFSYEIGGPEHGGFVADALSCSGSVTVVMNRFGDMYTRNYDLDTAGANHIPERYSWQRQERRPSAPNQLVERFDPRYPAVQLPAEDWRRQPRIPGEITTRLSIHDSGPRAEDRELRVEGRHEGRTGYWHKDIAAQAWLFEATDEPLAGRLHGRDDVDGGHPGGDRPGATLAPASRVSYRGGLPGGWRLRLDHFDWAQTTHPATLTSPTGRAYRVRLHTVDGLRLIPRANGLDRQPRNLEGALDVRGAGPSEAPELTGFVDTALQGRRIFEVDVQATTDRLVIQPLGGVLDRVD